MKKWIPLACFGAAAVFIFSINLYSQEKTEVAIQVKKDGKIVKDTTYQFEDADEAEHAMKMIEILSGDDEEMMEYSYTTHHNDTGHANTMVFISKDGKKTEIKELHGDSLVWVSEDEDATWQMDDRDRKDVDKDVYVISGDEVKVELKEIMEDHEGEDVKVVVIEKKIKKKQKKQ